MNQLSCLKISYLDAKSWVANEFLDLLTCYDLPEQGLDKIILNNFRPQSVPFENEVVSRLANMCPQINYLQLSEMDSLSEKGRM